VAGGRAITSKLCMAAGLLSLVAYVQSFGIWRPEWLVPYLRSALSLGTFLGGLAAYLVYRNNLVGPDRIWLLSGTLVAGTLAGTHYLIMVIEAACSYK
jgi:hypothetical protein